ncbi:hypothetical protein D3C71_1537230 [compost metagenome]
MARHHVAQVGQRAQQQVQRHRAAVAEHRRVSVGRVDGLQVKLQGRTEVQVLLPEFQRVVLHIGRGERLAIMPGDAFAQLERDGLAVRIGGPGGGQLRHRLASGVQVHQRFDDLAGHDVDAGGGAQGRVQDALFRAQVHVQHPAVTRRGALGEQRRGKGHRGGKRPGRQQELAAIGAHLRTLILPGGKLRILGLGPALEKCRFLICSCVP